MAKLNIRQGDVPETLEEVDAAIEQMHRIEANKQARRNAARGKNSAKNDRQAKLAIVRTDEDRNTVDVVAQPEALVDQLALKVAPKPKKEKAPKVKTPKAPVGPQYLSKDLNPRGKTLLTPELVVRVFEDKVTGLKNPQIAEKYNISQGSVSTILSGPAWFRERMTRYGGEGWVYPRRAEKTSEQKAE